MKPTHGVWRAGLFAGAAAVATYWAISGVVAGTPFPPVVVAEAVLRATPGDVATFFIESLGEWALRLLNVGAILVAVVAAGFALVMTKPPRPWTAASGVGVLSMVTGLLAPGADVSIIGTIVAVLAAVAAYGWIARRALRTDGVHDVDLGRRRALASAGRLAMGVAAGGAAVGWFARRLGGPDTDVPIVMPEVPAAAPARQDFPDIAGLAAEVTPVEDHYVVDINFLKPSVEAEGWTLRVEGSVDTPLELTFTELQERFEIVEEFSTLTCVSNEVGGPLIGNSAWGGIQLADLLQEAGIGAAAADVVFHAADRYSDSFPIEAAMDPSVLLAVSQNGKPLTQDHGFPCRVRAPAYYGMKNVKWVTSIEVVDANYEGYWQKRGWSDVALVRTQSRIDVAGDDRSAAVGDETWIAGVAWAGDRGISKVEVSTDGGETWNEAMLRDPIADNSWRQWAYRWAPVSAGSIEVKCRATDGSGEVQTARREPPHPAGATGYHSVSVDVS